MVKFDFAKGSWVAAVICVVLFMTLTHVYATFALLSVFFCALALFIGLTVKVEDC